MQPELSKMVAATLSIAERQVARTLDLLEGGATILLSAVTVRR